MNEDVWILLNTGILQRHVSFQWCKFLDISSIYYISTSQGVSPTSPQEVSISPLTFGPCQGKRSDIKPHEWDKFGYVAKVSDRFLKDDDSK